MSGDHKNLVTKNSCDDRNNVIKEKIVDLKANIHTSKESLGNRLDKVDSELQKALLGDVSSPGGLCGEVSELKRDIEEATKDWEEHKVIIDDKVKTQNSRMKLCLALVGILIGGKVLGFSIETITNYIKPTPITSTAPVEQDDNEIPAEIKNFIKEKINKPVETITVPEDVDNVN